MSKFKIGDRVIIKRNISADIFWNPEMDIYIGTKQIISSVRTYKDIEIYSFENGGNPGYPIGGPINSWVWPEEFLEHYEKKTIKIKLKL